MEGVLLLSDSATGCLTITIFLVRKHHNFILMIYFHLILEYRFTVARTETTDDDDDERIRIYFINQVTDLCTQNEDIISRRVYNKRMCARLSRHRRLSKFVVSNSPGRRSNSTHTEWPMFIKYFAIYLLLLFNAHQCRSNHFWSEFSLLKSIVRYCYLPTNSSYIQNPPRRRKLNWGRCILTV